jgi:polygalacturonase
VLIENVTIASPADAPNTDGIDPSGRDMLIQNVTIDTGDDNIAIKSGQDDPAHPGAATANIVIRNCTFRHGHGLSIGSETNGGVQNVLAENITFDGTTTALRIKTSRGRGGTVKGVVYRNIRMANVGQAVLITAYYPKIPPEDDAALPVDAKTPDISDIRLENVTGQTGIKKLGGVIGLPERPVRGVVFDRVTLTADKPLDVRNAEVTLNGSVLALSGGPGADAIVKQVGASVASPP